MRHTQDEGESSHSERENHYLPTLQSESHREEDKKHESFFRFPSSVALSTPLSAVFVITRNNRQLNVLLWCKCLICKHFKKFDSLIINDVGSIV